MRIVKLSRKNLKTFLKVAYACFKSKTDRKNIRWAYNMQITKKHENLTRLEYFLFYEGKNPVGVTGLYEWKNEKKKYWLGWYCVIPKERKKGYGSKILNWTLSRAKKLRGKTFWIYTTSKRAQKFYAKRGFKKSSKKAKWVIVDGKKIFKYEPQLFSLQLSLLS